MEKEVKDSIIIPGNLYVFKNLSRSKNKPTYQFRLTLFNSKLTKIINKLRLKNINNARALVAYSDNIINITKSKYGALFKPDVNNQMSYLSVANYLTESVKNELKSKIKDKSYSKKVKVKLNFKKWGLNQEDIFLESKEENELAKELIYNGYKISSISGNGSNKLEYGCADILIRYDNMKIPIEITTTQPTKSIIGVKSGVNAPHGHVWLKVSGRILPVLLYTINKDTKSIVIINEEWKDYKHVKDILNKFKKLKCNILFSNFKEGWAKKIILNINKLLNN